MARVVSLGPEKIFFKISLASFILTAFRITFLAYKKAEQDSAISVRTHSARKTGVCNILKGIASITIISLVEATDQFELFGRE